MEIEEKLKAYIIKDIVNRRIYEKKELDGINDFLDNFTEDTLKQICEELEIKI